MFGVVLSYLSVFYGTSSFNAHVLYDKKPKISNVIKIFLIDFLYMVISYFILIEFSGYLMHYLVYNIHYPFIINIMAFIIIVFIINMLQLKKYSYLILCNDTITSTIVTFPHILFKGKHTLKDILKMRGSYSSWILIYLFSFVSMKYSISDYGNKSTFDSRFSSEIIEILFVFTLILSLLEYIFVYFFDTLIFKWAYVIDDESINNIDNSESVEIV